MLNLNTITNVINNALNSIKTPASVLPPFLLLCTAIKRGGMSASRAASSAIASNSSLGISTSENPDGSPNMVNEYTYNIIKTVIDTLKNEAVVHVAIPTGSLSIQSNGANAGGPVVSVGTNITNTVAYGIIR